MHCVVLLELTAKPGGGDRLLEFLREELPETRNKDGCLALDVTRDQDEPDRFAVLMRWASRGHYEAYYAWRQQRGDIGRAGDVVVGGLAPRFLDPVDA